MNVNKIVYRPVGLLVGVLGGLAATAVYRKVWELTTGDEEAPDPTDRDRGWGQILLAASVQGAIFGLAKAAFDRAGATGYKKVTGEWPDD